MDYSQPLKCYLQPAKNGFVMAQLRLGTMYYYGKGVNKIIIKQDNGIR